VILVVWQRARAAQWIRAEGVTWNPPEPANVEVDPDHIAVAIPSTRRYDLALRELMPRAACSCRLVARHKVFLTGATRAGLHSDKSR